MEYKYTYKNTASDLWQLNIYCMYSTMIGVCNVIFTLSVFAVTFGLWENAGGVLRAFLIMACLSFTVLQPFYLYQKARQQATGITQESTLCFQENGVHIKLGNQTQDLQWKQIRRIAKKPTMLIIFSGGNHGFVLPNRVLGKDKQALYEFLKKKTVAVKSVPGQEQE